jgi:hypothetical protein
MGSSASIKFFTKHEDDPKVGNAKVDIYANAMGMDDRNRAAMKVLVNGTKAEFIKHVSTGPDGKQLSYSEMRAIYG